MNIRDYIIDKGLMFSEFARNYNISKGAIRNYINREYDLIEKNKKIILTSPAGKVIEFSQYQNPKVLKKHNPNEFHKSISVKEIKVDYSKMACSLPVTNIIHDWVNDR